MNSLYEELAKIVVRDSLGVDASDVVVVTTWDHTIDVANAMVVECFRQGADAMMSLWTDEYYYGLLRELSAESLGVCSKICEAFTEAETATINMFGPKNPEGLKSISPSKLNAWGEGERKAHYPRNIERKIRNVTLPLALLTPERAKVYGFNFKEWKKAVDAALMMDLKRIASKGRDVEATLARARKVHLAASNGTDLTFELAKRPVHLDDGIIDKKDIENKSLDAQLPAGSILTTIAETSGNGKVIFDRPLQSMGLNVQNIEWKFKDGKVASMKAKKNLELLSKQFSEASGDKDRISFIQIGLNPKAEYGYLMDHIVEGAVQIGIGDNEYIGGKNSSTFGMAATLSKATLDIDGKTIIKNGRLATK
ncbi:MAG TPA: aminopeptidase [candidate division Zixibacteria bacterium]|nr:aminopeptidase [candidate division Zixibacteria bacterium]